jgi:beta-fructofuranosidase
VQYYRPGGPFYVGDCMPFFHEDTFHLYYLLDENHHQAKAGLGAHQWAHASTRDLVRWEHHPLAIGITEEREGSICTGSTFYHDGTFYGYYATRMLDRTQHLSLATSSDGIHFEKQLPNPFASPPQGYSPYDYRDPCVFRDEETGHFHLLVTASLEPYALQGRGGCLAHLVSPDLAHWELREPFLIPGYSGAPECPDYFHWHDWYYLVFSHAGIARYRMSRRPLGPWLRPAVDTFDGTMARVLKTAAFTGDRRIGVAFLGTRQDDRDSGRMQYAGNAIYREVIQQADGTLRTCWPAEMAPPGGTPLTWSPFALTPHAEMRPQSVHLAAAEGMEVAMLEDVPHQARLSMRIAPGHDTAAMGLRLRGAGAFESGYDLCFRPYERRVELFDASLVRVEGLDRSFDLDIILTEDIIDVCITGQRTMVNRCPELKGDRLFFFAHNGDVTFEEIQIRPLLHHP